VAAVQHTFTQNSTEYTENGTYTTIQKIVKCRPCPVFASYTLEFALQLRKNMEKPQVSRKVPDIPVAVVQYTFTHKQYTETYFLT
jgi:hypothetical protein